VNIDSLTCCDGFLDSVCKARKQVLFESGMHLDIECDVAGNFVTLAVLQNQFAAVLDDPRSGDKLAHTRKWNRFLFSGGSDDDLLRVKDDLHSSSSSIQERGESHATMPALTIARNDPRPSDDGGATIALQHLLAARREIDAAFSDAIRSLQWRLSTTESVIDASSVLVQGNRMKFRQM
jgi:hypothetical protein